MTEITFKMMCPTTPNYIRVNISTKDHIMVPIEELSNTQLEEIANEWKADLLKSAMMKRKSRSTNE